MQGGSPSSVQIKISNKKSTILNVLYIHLTMSKVENEDEYLRFAFINSFISENHTTSVHVVGDLNADI